MQRRAEEVQAPGAQGEVQEPRRLPVPPQRPTRGVERGGERPGRASPDRPAPRTVPPLPDLPASPQLAARRRARGQRRGGGGGTLLRGRVQEREEAVR